MSASGVAAGSMHREACATGYAVDGRPVQMALGWRLGTRLQELNWKVSDTQMIVTVCISVRRTSLDLKKTAPPQRV